MKCLRCGKEMNNDEECTCGHFYETNLNKGRKLSSGKKKKMDPALSFTIFGGLFSLVIIIGGFLLAYLSTEPEKNEFCEKVCEGQSYEFKSNTCTCENGREYIVE